MSQLGYFGKTPHRGDFVRFNLPKSFIKVWDDWLQQVMIHGESLGDAWPELYSKAPTYLFALSSGIAGTAPWIGVLRPSQDKVGRRFPFCLAMALPEQALPCESVSQHRPFFSDAIELLDRVFAHDYAFDDLQGELASMAERHSLNNPMLKSPLTISSQPFADAVTIGIPNANALQSTGTLPALLDTVLQQTLGEYSLWITSENLEATVINSGLPVGAAALALIDSNWREASTAFLDLDTTSAESAHAETIPTHMIIDVPGDNHNMSLSTPELSDNFPGDLELLDIIVSSVQTTESDENSTSQPPDIAEQTPSADDWAALDHYAETIQTGGVVPIPEVEPLELEDDDVPDAPWEQ